MRRMEMKVRRKLIHSHWTHWTRTSDQAYFCAPEYGFPIDERELDRIDMCHAKYFALLEKKRFLAPITETPHKVLDLGCGTGEWDCWHFS
jgi:hypothetical protein